MSVIVWDGTTIAADKRGTNADLITVTTKLHKLDSGVVLGWTGTMEHGLGLMEWFKNGAKKEEWPSFQQKDTWTRLIVAHPDGHIVQYEQEPYPQLIESDRCAWGSGRDYAFGAMAMGADAIKAVEVASEFCSSCGNGVTSFKIVEAP